MLSIRAESVGAHLIAMNCNVGSLLNSYFIHSVWIIERQSHVDSNAYEHRMTLLIHFASQLEYISRRNGANWGEKQLNRHQWTDIGTIMHNAVLINEIYEITFVGLVTFYIRCGIFVSSVLSS